MKNFLPHLLLALSVFFCNASHAQEKNYWTILNKSQIADKAFNGISKPNAFNVFKLDETALKAGLDNASTKNAAEDIAGFIFSFPNADGKLEKYKVAPTTVIEPEIATRFPDIKTYSGQGIDDPSSIIHFDLSPLGFHGMIISSEKPTVYIDPLKDDGQYMVFSVKDIVSDNKTLHCLTEQTTASLKDISPGTIFKNANDGKLRTFRLALACTGEYGKYFLDGTEKTVFQKKIKILISMISLVVRVNGIFERDFGIHFNLVANTDVLFYFDPATDPWTDEWIITTSELMDAKIGKNYYDIGHLLRVSKPEETIGGLGSGRVCSVIKGGAYSATSVPGSDNFFVRTVCHEMAHQFGAHHTFTFKSEVGEFQWVQVEPQAGRSIMGYSDYNYDFFHAATIQEVCTYAHSLPCGVVKSIGNTAPIANAGADYTIPKSTPFVLTGTGTDANASDVKSYAWEQMDMGVPATSKPNIMATSGPSFEVMPLSNSPKRIFPELSTILSGATNSTTEALPAVKRALKFRFTVRDNHPGGGNNHSDDMVVNVTDNSGPFSITNPNTEGKIWTIGSSQNVTWNVANTTASPVSCANVKISLSTDGGLTFPTVLANSTANDGSHNIVVPNKPTIMARVKVEAIGNIFFDINNKDITIAPLPAPPCPDVYEPNNKQSEAKLIPVNTSLSGKMYPAGDEDYFKFTTTNDAPGFTINLTNLPVDCDMILYDNNLDEIGSSLNGGFDDELIEYNDANQGATYYLQIFGIGNEENNKDCYKLNVSTNSIISLAREQESTSTDHQVTLNKPLKIYPNPVKDNQLTVQFYSESKKPEQIIIGDLTGNILLKKNINTAAGLNNFHVRLPELASGIYIIKVGKETTKLTIQ